MQFPQTLIPFTSSGPVPILQFPVQLPLASHGLLQFGSHVAPYVVDIKDAEINKVMARDKAKEICLEEEKSLPRDVIMSDL